MKQNIYDHPDFFAGYAALRKNESGLNKVLEQPALRSILPPLDGKRVLDLGCGFGNFCRTARQQGAVDVRGVDLSTLMLNEARKQTDDSSIRYIHSALEDYSQENRSVEVIVSSLALHYVRDFTPLIQRVTGWLTPGGVFIFSVEHPICTSTLNGWTLRPDGTPDSMPVDRYHEEGQRQHRWFVDNVIKYHRTISTYLNTLIDCGLTIDRILEPEATSEALQTRPDLEIYHRCPPFLLVRASKKG